MGSIPLPALQIRQQPDVAEQFGKVMQLKQLMAAGQMQQIQLKQAQQQMDDQDKLRQLFQQNGGDLDKTIQAAPQAGVSANSIIALQNHNLQVKTQLATLTKDKLDNATKQNDAAAGLAQFVLNSKDKPAAYAQARQQILSNPEVYGVTNPSLVPPEEYPGDEAIQQQVTIHQGAKLQFDQEMKRREVAAQETAARARMLAAQNAAGKSGPLTAPQIFNLNKTLQNRYQVLNPSQPLPDEYKLSQGATQKDYETVDKALQQLEGAQGTKATQEATAAQRQFTNTIASQNAEEKKQTLSQKPVIGFDPKTQQQVFTNAGDAKASGLKSIREVGQAEAEKVTNARSLMPLLDSKDRDDPGLLQMAKALDAKGKLGPLAGRWNDFMSGKFGAGDPDYTAFRTKMGLSTTALMQVHVGSRGGAFMLEHFQDLANGGKMNGPNLLSALSVESKYVARKAMLPSEGGGQQLAPQSKPQTPALQPKSGFDWSSHPVVNQ